MKKWLCHLFNIYLLMLACVPCTDIHVRDVSSSIIIAAEKHSSCPHEKEGDNCSPFCICACCGNTLTTTPQYFVTLKSLPIITGTQIMPTSSDFIRQEVYAPIWRPPIV